MENKQEYCKVYVLLTRPETHVSRLIHKLTGDAVTHSSLAIDPDLLKFYSFGRYNARFFIPGGFIRETLSSGVFGNCPNAPCILLEGTVKKDGLQALRRLLEDFSDRKLRYDIPGAFYNYFGKRRTKEKKYVCSRFVAEALERAGVITLKKHASLYRPADFLEHPELRCIYRGTVGELNRKISEKEFLPSINSCND